MAFVRRAERYSENKFKNSVRCSGLRVVFCACVPVLRLEQRFVCIPDAPSDAFLLGKGISVHG